jgi:hypothetical protein
MLVMKKAFGKSLLGVTGLQGLTLLSTRSFGSFDFTCYKKLYPKLQLDFFQDELYIPPKHDSELGVREVA